MLFSWDSFHPALFLSNEGLSPEKFAGLGSIHFLGFWARACTLALVYLAVLFLAICRAVFMYFFLSFFQACSYAFFSLVNLLVSAILNAHFSYFSYCCSSGTSGTVQFQMMGFI